MQPPFLLGAWLVLAVPVVSLVEWARLRSKQKTDYSHYVEWKEFPLLQVTTGKVVFFSAVGLGSVWSVAPPEITLVALSLVGVCGFVIEGRIVMGRPAPTLGYRMDGVVCQNCSVSDHDHCKNMRMLDGFEKGFRSDTGHRRPVCCCGFRLGEWEEVEA